MAYKTGTAVLAQARLTNRSFLKRLLVVTWYAISKPYVVFGKGGPNDHLFFDTPSQRADQRAYSTSYLETARQHAHPRQVRLVRMHRKVTLQIKRLWALIRSQDRLAELIGQDLHAVQQQLAPVSSEKIYFVNEAISELTQIRDVLKEKGTYCVCFQHAKYPNPDGTGCAGQVVYALAGSDEYIMWDQASVNQMKSIRPNSKFSIIAPPILTPVSLTGYGRNTPKTVVFMPAPEHRSKGRIFVASILAQKPRQSIGLVLHPSDSRWYYPWALQKYILTNVDPKHIYKAITFGGTISEHLKRLEVEQLTIDVQRISMREPLPNDILKSFIDFIFTSQNTIPPTEFDV